MDIDHAIELVKRKWHDSGECRSCGHHAALYEYGDLRDAIWIFEEKGCVELSCLEDSNHRGVRINFDEVQP